MGHAETKSTRATAIVTTKTITLDVSLTVVTAARRVWASLSRKITANSANVWTRTPNRLRQRHAETKSTRATAIVTTTTTTLDVSLTVVTAARRVWASLSRKIT